MKKTAVLRVCSDICAFFAILQLFPVLRNARLPLALFAAACFVLGFVIVRVRSKALRLLLSLLPGLCLLLAGLHPMMLLPGLVWLYYILVMTAGNYAMPLDEYRRHFLIVAVVGLFFLVGNIANSTIYRGQAVFTESLVYMGLCLFLGVLAMREMQMGASMDLSWRLSNLLTALGVPLAAVSVSLGVFLLLRFCIPGVRYLFEPLGRLLLWLFHRFFRDGSPMEEMSLSEYLKVTFVNPFEEEAGVGNPSSHIGGDAEPFSHNPFPIGRAAMIGAYVVLAVLFLLAVWLIVSYARRNRALDESEELVYEETMDDGSPAPRRRKRKGAEAMRGHARQIRRMYLLYLEYIRGRGLTLGKGDTSQDILTRSKEIEERPEAERLRQIYIAARYGDPSAVGREQVEEARRCLDAILGGEA